MTIFIYSFEAESIDNISPSSEKRETAGGFVYAFVNARSLKSAANIIWQDLDRKGVKIIWDEYIYNYSEFDVEEFDAEGQKYFTESAARAKECNEIVYSPIYAYEDAD